MIREVKEISKNMARISGHAGILENESGEIQITGFESESKETGQMVKKRVSGVLYDETVA